MWRRSLTWVCRLNVMAIGLGLALGKLDRDASPLDLASHFQVVYLVGSVALAACLGAMRSWRWLAAAVLCAAVSSAAVLPWYFSSSDLTQRPGEPRRLRVLVANIYFLNDDFSGIAAAIRRLDADLVVLCELTTYGANELQDALGAYPHRLLHLQVNPQGIGLYSRTPLTSQRVEHLGIAGHPTLAASIDIDGLPLWVLATHPTRALTSDGHRLRNNQLAQLPSLLNALPGPKIVAGDLNTTMWSPFYQHLEAATGLVNARRGFGVVPTWPSFLPRIARLPIDHVLASQEVGVAAIRSVKLPGSDHEGLVVDLELRWGT